MVYLTTLSTEVENYETYFKLCLNLEKEEIYLEKTNQSIMTRYTSLNPQPTRVSKRSQFLFLLLCIVFPVYLIYLNAVQNASTQAEERLVQEALELIAQDVRFAERYRNKHYLNSELKYILLWTPKEASPFHYLGLGQEGFINNKCEFTNCYVTADRRFFGGNITKFDAVAINGRAMRYTTLSDLPQQRSPYQKFIFFNLESSTYQPVCNPWFDGFFNWTSTYKLNSDSVYSYIYIKNKEGKPVGPKIDMEWITDMKEVDEDFKKKLQSKTKAAAWFVSHCSTRSKREKYVKALQEALAPYKLTVDVYGVCGTFQCPRTKVKECDRKVKNDYYFYLSFENAFAEDYVTEKLLTALNNYAVPIVYGGANYSRFLPPGSYIDARRHEPEQLAALMARLIENKSEYCEFFRWRNHYSYSESEPVEDVCNLCSALNNETMVRTQSVYEHFRTWWNPDWKIRCQDDN